MSVLDWQAGEPATRRATEHALRHPTTVRVIRDNPRRRLLRLDAGDTGRLLLKQFRVGSGRHPRRDRAKRALGLAAADREWRTLNALHAAGVPVPEPLGRARLPDGDELVIVRFVEGRSVADVAGDPPGPRRAALTALGRAVAALHAAGYAHQDLHHGNVLFDGAGAVLLDLQRTRRAGPGRRLRDLGWLDYSLWPWLSAPDRLRVRRAALGDTADRETLRRVGREAERRADRHARSRTRRCLRPGRRFARIRIDDLRGLRLRDLSADAARAAVAAHRAALGAGDARVLKDDGRSRITAVDAGGRRVVVKETPGRGWRPLVDRVRGSAGRRAWRGGHGLQARGVGAATPLLFLDERRLGRVRTSLVVLEDLRPAPAADRAEASGPARVIEALGRLVLALHRRAIDHGDLKASHVYLASDGTGLEPRLIDLDRVRFPARLTDAARLHALAQLNASLPDVFPGAERRRAFTRYAAALPFAVGRGAALAEVVARSLARRHRWSGAGCRTPSSAAPERPVDAA